MIVRLLPCIEKRGGAGKSSMILAWEQQVAQTQTAGLLSLGMRYDSAQINPNALPACAVFTYEDPEWQCQGR
jgi:hypothetical protein